MAGDLIAKKRKFHFEYAVIAGDELDYILSILWETNQIFLPLSYLENGKQKYASIYSGAIPTVLHSAGKTTNWVWKDVNFDLIER